MKLLQRGFTLIELLIVVVILAVLAAIVIPQFSISTADAQETALDSNLTLLRSAIDLYKAQHGGKYPGDVAATGATCVAGSTAGSGAASSAIAMTQQLSLYSTSGGATCDAPGGVAGTAKADLGPYLRNGMPADPIKINKTISLFTVTGLPLTASGMAGGWGYDTKSGQIIMNSTANDSKAVPYSTH